MFNSGENNAFAPIIGSSPALESVIRTAQIAAATDVHILIEGETGTGNKSRAAKLLGLSRDAFLYRLKKYNL